MEVLQIDIDRCRLDEAISAFIYGEITRTGISVGSVPERL